MSTSPKNKSGWAFIFIAIFFITPFKAAAAKEPKVRVLIGQVNKASFRADGKKSIFVKGISSNQIPIKSLSIVYNNGSVNYSINNNQNTWFN